MRKKDEAGEPPHMPMDGCIHFGGRSTPSHAALCSSSLAPRNAPRHPECPLEKYSDSRLDGLHRRVDASTSPPYRMSMADAEERCGSGWMHDLPLQMGGVGCNGVARCVCTQ